MSLRRLVERELRRRALLVLDSAAPGVVELLQAAEQWTTERAAIETADASRMGPGEAAAGLCEGEGPGDTVAVEITDERGCVVGWTVATVTTKR